MDKFIEMNDECNRVWNDWQELITSIVISISINTLHFSVLRIQRLLLLLTNRDVRKYGDGVRAAKKSATCAEW